MCVLDLRISEIASPAAGSQYGPYIELYNRSTSPVPVADSAGGQCLVIIDVAGVGLYGHTFTNVDPDVSAGGFYLSGPDFTTVSSAALPRAGAQVTLRCPGTVHDFATLPNLDVAIGGPFDGIERKSCGTHNPSQGNGYDNDQVSDFEPRVGDTQLNPQNSSAPTETWVCP